MLSRGGHVNARGKVAGTEDGRVVEAQDDIPRLQSPLSRRAPRLNLRYERATGRAELEGLCQRLIDVLHLDAQLSMLDLACFNDLLLNLLGDIDRDGKGHALIAAGVGVDLGVDTHHGP